jgi:hypothetical protein
MHRGVWAVGKWGTLRLALHVRRRDVVACGNARVPLAAAGRRLFWRASCSDTRAACAWGPRRHRELVAFIRDKFGPDAEQVRRGRNRSRYGVPHMNNGEQPGTALTAGRPDAEQVRRGPGCHRAGLLPHNGSRHTDPPLPARHRRRWRRACWMRGATSSRRHRWGERAGRGESGAGPGRKGPCESGRLRSPDLRAASRQLPDSFPAAFRQVTSSFSPLSVQDPRTVPLTVEDVERGIRRLASSGARALFAIKQACCPSLSHTCSPAGGRRAPSSLVNSALARPVCPAPGLLPPPSVDLDVHKWLLTFSNDALELASHVGTNPQVRCGYGFGYGHRA